MRNGLLTSFIVLILDQLSKIWVLHYFASLGTLSVALLPPLNLVLVWNHGISFGMLQRHGAASPFIPLLIALVMLVVLVIWLKRSRNTLESCALGMIIGGAVGNVIDRLRLGAVVDFIDFHIANYHWPAFNVADSAICIGVVFLCWQTLASESSKEIP